MGGSLADLPPDLAALLAADAAAAPRDAVRRTLHPALRLTERRVGRRVLHPGCLGRLLGRRPAVPELSVLASKYGGVPYLEAGEVFPRSDDADCVYVGQLNFAEFPSVGADVPEAGLLTLYLNGPTEWDAHPLQWRWYQNPDAQLRREVPVPRCVMPHEYRIQALPALSFDLGAVDATASDRGRSPVHQAIGCWFHEHGGDVGCPWPYGAGDFGPRYWHGEAPPAGETPTHLWNVAPAWICGSMAVSLLAPPGAARAGDLSRLYVLSWQ